MPSIRALMEQPDNQTDILITFSPTERVQWQLHVHMHHNYYYYNILYILSFFLSVQVILYHTYIPLEFPHRFVYIFIFLGSSH